MAGLPLSMTCGPYDRARALIEGSVRPEGIDLTITVNADDRERQMQAIAGRFDVAECFTGALIADIEQQRLGLTAIPVFVKRMFRHSYIYVNKRAGIRSPTDLHGKRVGVQTWFTTAAVWARGLLAEECGVDLGAVRWQAEQAAGPRDWQPPAWLQLELAPPGAAPLELLASGVLDAAITTETWAPGVHPDIDFLFPDYAARERDYYKRTGCFPIHHTLAVKSAVLNAHPWVARSLFDAWQESKQRCYEWLAWQRIHQTSLWYRALWEEEQALGGDDYYRWGFRDTRGEVALLLRYCHEQGLTARQHAPEELFHSSTLDT